MEYISMQELNQMLAQVNERDSMGVRDYVMVQLMAYTGLRVGELAGLDHFDVWVDGKVRPVLFVRGQIAKGGKSRQVPMCAIAQQAVARLVSWNKSRGFSTSPNAPLFSTKSHRRITTRAVQYVVKELRERAQLAVPASPHSARHLFASRIAETTGNIAVVAKLMGHTRLSTSGIYVRLSYNDHPKQAVNHRTLAGRRSEDDI